MKEFRTAVRSVKMKGGGAEIRVIRNSDAAYCRQGFDRHAADISERRRDDMAGYVIAAWSFDGSTSTVSYNGRGSRIGKPMVPDFVRTLLIDEMNDKRGR